MNRDPRAGVATLGRYAAANPYRLVATAVALLAGLVVFAVAHEVFPYHSANHDEGVYLQQAAMLLDGRLHLTPGSDALREAVHPWFFVESDAGLYPKYTPVPAVMFAGAMLVGEPRLALGVIAAVNVGLGYALAAAAFDRRTGVLAAVTMAASPLFLVSSAVFLPYAPTTVLNLLFAVAYVRSIRRADSRYALLAGAAIGLAFFARPYTAVLFASPFVLHALWRIGRAVPQEPAVLVRYGLTAVVATGFVGLALAYNAVLTGSPFLFPYEAFAPRDGVGFGRRALLGYERLYTPALAVRANAIVLWTFATGWFTAGLFGTALAGLGLASVLVALRRDGLDRVAPMSGGVLQLLLCGVVVTVVVGNLLFWGNLNILVDVDRPGGFISLFGPIYHFDLLLPLAALAAHGAVTAVDAFRARLPTGTHLAPVAAVLLLAISLFAVGAAQADALGPPLAGNAAYTEKYDRAYAPFEKTELGNALVFLPPTFGEWRNHPFQWLRNDPGLDGPAVYVLSRDPADDFAVWDLYSERDVYRYRYHGQWTDDPNRHVYPLLERVQPVEATSVTARTNVAVPDRIVGVDVAVSAGETVHRLDYRGEVPREMAIEWTLGPDNVSVDHPELAARTGDGSVSVPLDGPTEVTLTVTITEPSGSSLTYREALLVRPGGDRVEVLWPSASSACPLVTDCGLRGTYVPDRPETRPTGVAMNTTLADDGA